MTTLVACLLAAPQLTAGFAYASFPSGENVPLGGYTQRADRRADPGGLTLGAQFISFETEESRVLLGSADLLTIPQGFSSSLGERVADYDSVILCATHTHCAPDSQMLNPKMTTKIPGIAAYSRSASEDFLRSLSARRRFGNPSAVTSITLYQGDFNGAEARMDGARPSQLATRIRFEAGTNTFEILHYAAHPTILTSEHNTTHGDWPGAWRALAPVPSLVLLGAAGDIQPKAEGDGVEAVESYARELDRVVREGARPRSVKVDEFEFVTVAVDLPAVTPHPDFASRNGIPNALAQSLVGMFADTTAEVSVLRVGELALLFVPGELSSFLGRELEQMARNRGIEHPLVVTIANQWLGYILSKTQYDGGGYEATLAFHSSELGDRLLEAMEVAITGATQNLVRNARL